MIVFMLSPTSTYQQECHWTTLHSIGHPFFGPGHYMFGPGHYMLHYMFTRVLARVDLIGILLYKNQGGS